MNQPTLSPASEQAVGLALRIVSESRQRMNTYSDAVRESLETKAREIIADGKQAAAVHCPRN